MTTISLAPLLLPVTYLAIHTAYVLTARFRPQHWRRLISVNAILAACFMLLAGLAARSTLLESGWLRIAVLWSPLVFFWWAYLWVKWTLHAYHPKSFSYDPLLIRLEARLFGQPSLWLAGHSKAWAADLWHAFYNTYYFYALLLGIQLHWSGRLRDFQSMTVAVILGYAVAYSFFPWMPVWGPRWGLLEAGLLKPDQQRLEGTWMTRVTNRIMYEGLAHKGCAMPSAHSSTAVVFLVWCWRIWGPAGGVPALVIVLGMAFGAVYGRYHYLLDVIAGSLLGAAALLAADVFLFR